MIARFSTFCHGVTRREDGAAAVEFAQTFGQLQATRSYRQLEDVAEAQFIDIARRRAEIAFDRKRLRRSGERGH